MLIGSESNFESQHELKYEPEQKQDIFVPDWLQSEENIYVPGWFQQQYGINPWDDDWDDGM